MNRVLETGYSLAQANQQSIIFDQGTWYVTLVLASHEQSIEERRRYYAQDENRVLGLLYYDQVMKGHWKQSMGVIFSPNVEKRKVGCTRYEARIAAGAHLPTPWLFEPTKRKDCRFLHQCKHQVLVFTLEWSGARLCGEPIIWAGYAADFLVFLPMIVFSSQKLSIVLFVRIIILLHFFGTILNATFHRDGQKIAIVMNAKLFGVTFAQYDAGLSASVKNHSSKIKNNWT